MAESQAAQAIPCSKQSDILCVITAPNARCGPQVSRQLRCEGYVRGLAWDPEGTYVAAAQGDGLLLVFDASTGKAESKKRVVRKVRTAG